MPGFGYRDIRSDGEFPTGMHRMVEWRIPQLLTQGDVMQHCIFISVFRYSPWRIVDDCGGAFTMGAIGGGIFQAIKGFRNSPVVSQTI